jgi:hypothetical protein
VLRIAGYFLGTMASSLRPGGTEWPVLMLMPVESFTVADARADNRGNERDPDPAGRGDGAGHAGRGVCWRYLPRQPGLILAPGSVLLAVTDRCGVLRVLVAGPVTVA